MSLLWSNTVRETPLRSVGPSAMFEAEIKYSTAGPVVPPGEYLGSAEYADVYFDRPDGSFYAAGRELRLRRTGGRTLLTGKLPPFDQASQSKEEWETSVDDGAVMAEILQNLGFVRRVAFTKQCRLFRDVSQGLALTITVVNVDFSPETFVEIEHPAADREAGLAALPVIRDYAARLGLATECPTCYTELCRSARTGTTPKGASPP